MRYNEIITETELPDFKQRQQELVDALNLFHATKDEFGLEAPVTQSRLKSVQIARKHLEDLGDSDNNNDLRFEIPDDAEPHIKSKFHHYKPRGGFNIAKIRNQIRQNPGLSSSGNFKNLYDNKGRSTFAREIRQFATPKEFAENLYWHGSGNGVSGSLKPGAILPKHTEFGGGYGEPYHVISLSKSKNIASDFTGQSRHGAVYPVLLRKGAKVISMPGVTDSQELEDILPKIWERRIDAIKIGDWSNPNSEQELCVINPRSIVRGGGEWFPVFNKQKFEEPTMNEIKAVFDQAMNPPQKTP